MTHVAQPRTVDIGRHSKPLTAAHLRAMLGAVEKTLAIALNDVEPAGGKVRVTVIVPTRNEADNIPELLARLCPELASLSAEILVVDDSDDDTPEALASCAASYEIPIRLMHRAPRERTAGLGGAVIAGVRQASGEWVLVMDADLQHPPVAAVRLANIALRNDVDIMIGTRYAGAGSVEGLNGARRLMTSSVATRLVRTLFPRLLATVSDPMSGLFAFRRSAIDVDKLNPIGFKILLEILVRNRSARVAEVSYEMATRHAGDSKASLREGLRFLRHLYTLRRGRLVGQLRERPRTRQERMRELTRMVGFGLVGLSGVAVNTAALWFFHTAVGVHHLVGAALATQVSTTWNFLLVDLLVYRHGRQGSWAGRATRFFLLNNSLLLLRLPVLQLLVWSGTDLLMANGITLVGLFLFRFLVSDRVIYRTGAVAGRDPVRLLVDLDAAETLAKPSRKRYQYLKYRYDVAGVVTIGSQILLPELEFFRSQWVHDADVDIAVRVGDIGGRGPKRRAALTEYANQSTLRYEEHLGRLGANFRIELGSTINIEVGPLLARSPHVVYTNIIEALLRFVMVSRGRMLLHSACVILDGVGVMLSALTDTGKTATVLRLLRDHGGVFLSDDMTVVDANGTAICFPKPLTISSHTLRAVRANDLTPAEWRKLQWQSRLHSKGGRSLALTLARFNLPIMGINAITQRLVPPPKYTVDRLVPCRIGATTQVRELFIIERGVPSIRSLDHASTLEQMITNTDDAYGFPPFRYLAPAITINGEGYTQLRERERDILSSFLANVRTRAISSDCFGWADEIPRLLAEERVGSASIDLNEPNVAMGAPSWPRWDAPVSAAGTAM